MRGSSSGWQVEHQCPQCGGPVTLTESDRLFSCSFCRVRLYFLGGDFFRYYIPPSGRQTEEIYYVPYWHFRGACFSCVPFEVKGRVIDASFLASGQEFFPQTLGVRAQALKVRFVSPEVEGSFFRVAVPIKEVPASIERLAITMDAFEERGTVLSRSYAGESISMIYAPVYVRGRAIFDAVLDRPMKNYTLQRADEFERMDEKKNWKVGFLPALCPECGWDLQGASQSLVLLCRHCGTAWKEQGRDLKRLEIGIGKSKEKGVCYVPFWRMRIKAKGIALDTLADLVRAANLPRAVLPAMEGQELYFWLPAFKVEPRLFLRLGRILTVVQPELELEAALPEDRETTFAPVTLGAAGAAGVLKSVFATVCSAKRKVFPMLGGIDITLKDASLTFLPFRPMGVDLVETTMNFRIPGRLISCL